jgi:hypothetical protein
MGSLNSRKSHLQRGFLFYFILFLGYLQRAHICIYMVIPVTKILKCDSLFFTKYNKE